MSGWLKTEKQEEIDLFVCGGDWRLTTLERLDAALSEAIERLERTSRHVRLVLEPLERLDTAGGWLIVRTIRRFEADGKNVELVGTQPKHAALLDRLKEIEAEPVTPDEKEHPLIRCIGRIGRSTIAFGQESCRFFSFSGAVTLGLLRQVIQPRRIRLVAIAHHVEMSGVNAIPIVGLMAFLIGVVLAYQGADQLRQFGAEIFTVDLLAVSILRELGVLLTAIMVAGRSGSAFAAQIGTMKINEELDAMEVIGLDRLDVIVTPRIVALFISLPLLTFLADIMALVGGGMVVVFLLDLPLLLFLRQLQDAVGADLFIAGMIKAPIFAVLIATVGCYMGLKVGGDAASVGRLTTQAVVVGIFLVIVVDAAFSVLFATFGI